MSRMFPDLPPFPPEHRAELRKGLIAGGAVSPEDADLLIDMMVHAVNEATATFEAVCERLPESLSFYAKLNGVLWLNRHSHSLMQSLTKVLPAIGLTLTTDGERIAKEFSRKD